MIRVAIADDSPFTCNLLASYLEEGGDCQVVGIAHDARSTLELVQNVAPDVLTLDLQMPGGNGLDLLRQIAERSTVSIVVISGVTKLAAATTLHALELGAVDFVLKFTPGVPVTRASLKREILAKVKTAATAHRVTRRPAAIAPPIPAADAAAPRPPARPAAFTAPAGAGAVIIGASTGGPAAISELLAQLPSDFSLPCLIVQHLPATFTAPFAAHLARHSRLAVKEAERGDRLAPGRVLVAPGACHVALRAGGAVELQPAGDDDVCRPSIDRAMASAAEVYGKLAIGVILTGMGHDGAEGLKQIHEAGGETYVQDAMSCVTSSMPAHAIARAGADHVAPPARIGQMLAGRGHS